MTKSRGVRAARRKWLRRAGGDPELALELYGVVKLRRLARRAKSWPLTGSLKAWRAEPWWVGYAERAAEAEAFDRVSVADFERLAVVNEQIAETGREVDALRRELDLS